MSPPPPADERRVPSRDPDPVELDERKERVLHTRVPDSLDRQLKRRARSLGLSVSTVVRHVLLNTFGLVEDIVTDGTNLALAISGHDVPAAEKGPARASGGAAPEAAPAEVLGWQEAVLNVNAVCEHCNAILRRGVRAAVGVRDQPGPRAIICRRCLEAIEAKRAPSPAKRG